MSGQGDATAMHWCWLARIEDDSPANPEACLMPLGVTEVDKQQPLLGSAPASNRQDISAARFGLHGVSILDGKNGITSAEMHKALIERTQLNTRWRLSFVEAQGVYGRNSSKVDAALNASASIW